MPGLPVAYAAVGGGCQSVAYRNGCLLVSLLSHLTLSTPTPSIAHKYKTGMSAWRRAWRPPLAFLLSLVLLYTTDGFGPQRLFPIRVSLTTTPDHCKHGVVAKETCRKRASPSPWRPLVRMHSLLCPLALPPPHHPPPVS